jgi:hypothetical protein
MKQGHQAERNRHPGARALLTRPEWLILLCLCSAAPFLLTFWVHGDGIGYVAYLHSAVVDRDLNLSDEFEYLASHMQADAWGVPVILLSKSSHRPGLDPAFHAPRPDPVTGRVPSNFSIGPAIAWAPAYLIAHGLTLLRGTAGTAERADGYGGLYYLAIALSSFAFGVAGLLLAYRLTSIAAPRREALWSVLTAVFLDDVRLALPHWTRRGRCASGAPAVTARARLLAPLAAFGFSVWNLLLLAQYALGMISHTEPVSLVTIAANQPKVVDRLVRLLAEVLK